MYSLVFVLVIYNTRGMVGRRRISWFSEIRKRLSKKSSDYERANL